MARKEALAKITKPTLARNRMSELYKIIQDAEQEIQTIRKDICTHPAYRVGYFSWRVGAMDLKRLCRYCDEVVGDPTQQERDGFYAEQAKRTRDCAGANCDFMQCHGTGSGN